MGALLVHQGLIGALKGSKLKIRSKKSWINPSSIILSLQDKPLREVARERSAQVVWLKLEQLYMTKSLANRLYLKHRLYFQDARR